MSSAFDKLSPALQYQIVNGLGFESLRPIQEQAIEAVLSGDNCVILAPTAGGKTESAFFPLLSLMDTEDWRPVSVLYVTPLRALLNNQEPRLSRYGMLLGRRAFKWHGDVTPGQKRGFIADPADILLTTPESLELMLMSTTVPARRLFASLRAVVIDEIHAFVSDDRGGHLSALLERLSRFCGRDVQRIGLSATVGNPAEILAWAAGSSRRRGQVVTVAAEPASPELAVDFVGSRENAARVAAALNPGKKRLVFVDSRRGVEAVGAAMNGLGIEVYLTHSSLAKSERERAETAFAERSDCVIVTTSVLELGIDIGDLDHVLQVDSPATVASFLQRMGRSGRRPGTQPNCTFLATNEDALLQIAALLRLHASGFVEPLRPNRRAAHLLAHQILALSIQESGLPRGDIAGWVGAATPFAELTPQDHADLLAHMLAREILHEDGGRLSLGTQGERLYGKKNFLELYAVFSTPETFMVLYGHEEIGTVEARFLEQAEREELTFTLAGQAWRATHIDWSRGIVHVRPCEQGRLTRWRGHPVLLHARLCQAMREVLQSGEELPFGSRRARERMQSLREEYAFLGDAACPLVATATGYRLWTFAGGRANLLLARTLESILGQKATAGNLYVGLHEQAGQSEAAIRDALRQLRATDRPNGEDALRFAESCGSMRLSKFQPCLTPRLEAQYLADSLIDVGEARRVVVRAGEC